MKRLSTSLLIFILALLALPERMWAEDVYLLTAETIKSTPGSYTNPPSQHKFTNTSGTEYTYTFSNAEASEDIYFRISVSGRDNMRPANNDDPLTINGDKYSITDKCYGKNKVWKLTLDNNKYSSYTITVDISGNNRYVKVTGVSSGPATTTTYNLVYLVDKTHNGKQLHTWLEGGATDEGITDWNSRPTIGSGDFATTKTYNGTEYFTKTFSVNKTTADNYKQIGAKIGDNGLDCTSNVISSSWDNVQFIIVTSSGVNIVENTATLYTVTVSSANETMGTVSPTGEQQIGSTGVEVIATPASGYEFVNWTTTGGVNVASASSATTTVTATADGTLTANFKATSTDPDPDPTPTPQGVKLYVKNDANWTGDMYAYVFKTDGKNAPYPGVQMVPVRGNENYDYVYTVPDGFENGYVVFSAGTNRFPAEGRSGFGIRNASHLYNNKNNTWTAPHASTIEGKNSVTIYAYINNDLAWYPADDGDSNGNIAIGTNFYIFAYTNADNSEYHAYDSSKGDTKLTTNDYNPGYGKTAGTAYNDYGDYCDETVYPVGYSGKSDLRYAKFVIYYDKELEGKTAFYTLNSGSLGKGQTSSGENYQIRQVFKESKEHIDEKYRGTPYYYYLPSVQLENGTSYYFKLGFANNYMHQSATGGGINFENYQIEDASSDVAKIIFPTVTLDDDYGCTKGQDNSGKTFYKEATENEAAINIWDKGSTYNVDMYRPFYSDGLYETICLPFDVPTTEVSQKFGEGTRLFKVTAATETEITFTEQTEANCYIEAGVPYIILPKLSDVEGSKWNAGEKNGTVISFAAKEMKFAYNNESAQAPLKYTDKESNTQSLTMKGCFIPYVIGKADRFFNTTTDNQNVFYQQAYNDRRVIRGTRVFFNDTKDPEVTVSVGGQQVSAKSIIIDSEDEPIVTGLYAPETGKIEVLKDTRVFSISGQYVGTSFNGLSKGIYVVNGKKVVIK